MRGVHVLAIVVLSLSTTTTVAACAGPDCKSIAYLDFVTVELPQALTADAASLELCVDGVCGTVPGSPNTPQVVLNGRILRIILGPTPHDHPPAEATIRLTDSAQAVDVTTKQRWHIDRHGGCATSRFIRLRFDSESVSLITA